MPKGQKERYTIGTKGTYGCKGYPVVGAGGKVHGCHTSRASARQQQAAIYASTGDTKKSETILNLLKVMFQEGDLVIGELNGDMVYGSVEYVMEEGVFGSESSSFSLKAEPNNPVVAVRIWEDGQETPYLVGFMSSDIESLEQFNQDNMDDTNKSNNEQGIEKASSVRIGQMVTWNSSGGSAKGKVVRVVRQGSLKVPGSDFTINAENDDPAVLIRVYRDGKPTETLVGHKMSTLNVVSKSEWSGSAFDLIKYRR